MKKLSRWVVVVLAVTGISIAIAMLAMGSKTEAAGGCVCPMVYAPVQCSNGKTYSNLCVANCNRATGCVPLPGYPPPR